MLQHSKTGLFLAPDGSFTGSVSVAHKVSDLTEAVLFCRGHHLSAAQFVYRVLEVQPEPLFTLAHWSLAAAA
ncbi:MAG TPA: hypothetical protein VGR78_17915 [Verrucomicrobiae bacterium]|nr:hypothetical protein [Verrucomicrobiae bacterium]